MSNPIERLREIRRLRDVRIRQKAVAVYATFTPDERVVVRFGMLPSEKTLAAVDELAHEFLVADGQPCDEVELSRNFGVAVMDVANAGPDKLVV